MSIISSNSVDRFSILKEEIYRRGYRKVSDSRWSCPTSRGVESGYLRESHDSNGSYFYTTIETPHIRKDIDGDRIEVLDKDIVEYGIEVLDISKRNEHH